jgi:hypothetical protein
MMRPSPTPGWHAATMFARALMLAVAAGSWAGGSLSAQTPATGPEAVRTQIERLYDALPVRGGIALRPKTALPGVRSIEVTGGAIAIDGRLVTGAELRDKLGVDADLILQLSYLDPAVQRSLFESVRTPGPAPAAPLAEAPIPDTPATTAVRRDRHTSDRIRFGGSVSVGEDETVEGDVVVIGGSANVKGEVTGDVVAVGGSIQLGPRANVHKGVVVVGGSLHRETGARIGGEIQEVGFGDIDMSNWRPRGVARQWWSGRTFGSAFSLVSTLVRVGMLCLLAALVMLFARDHVTRIGSRAAAEPLKAGAIGLLVQLLFLPLLIVTTLLFVITIVGIPLLILIPFAILFLMVLALVGFTGVASYVGHEATGRLGLTGYGPYATTMVGILLIVSPILLARLVGLAGGPLWLMSFGLAALGFVFEYVAWTVGLGAIALVRFNDRVQNPPPPLAQ